MASNQNLNSNLSIYPQTLEQLPRQTFNSSGLSFWDNNNKFIGVFTATHLSICLIVTGFGLTVTGLLSVVTKASLDEKAFHVLGIALICFGCLLVVIAVSILVFAIRWGKKRVHVLERSNNNYPSVPMMAFGYSYPVFTNTRITPNNNNNNFDNLQISHNIPTPTTSQESFYPLQLPQNPNFLTFPQQLIAMRPTAPLSSVDSVNNEIVLIR